MLENRHGMGYNKGQKSKGGSVIQQIEVAGVKMHVQSADRAFFAVRFREYAASFPAPDMTMKTLTPEELPPVEGREIAKIRNAAIYETAGGRCCAITSPSSGKTLSAQYFNSDYSNVEIQLLKSRTHPVLSLTDWEYMYTGAMFGNRLMYMGGVVLHGSAISYRGRGVVFSAPSGTGKSTHTGLWKQAFAEDVEILNDDKPAICFQKDGPYLFGTPWSGKTDLNRNRSAPLQAIVFLEQAADNSMVELPVTQKIFQLTSQIARPYYDREIGIRAMDAVQRLVESVPIYLLRCNISRQAVDVCYHRIFEA